MKAFNLFTYIEIHPGQVAEFPPEMLFPPQTKFDRAVTIEKRGADPTIYPPGDTVIVPHFDIKNEDEEGQKAIDKTMQEINEHARKLLLFAANLNEEPLVGANFEDLYRQMNTKFSSLLGIGKNKINVNAYVEDDEIVWIADKDFAIITVHSPVALWHTPHIKPVCWADLGFAVLDHRCVLRGKICQPGK
jgi:hypothetical protein